MPAKHLSRVTLERFAATNLTPERMIEAGRHLSVCTHCRRQLKAEVQGGAEILERLVRKGWPTEESVDNYGQVFERLHIDGIGRILQIKAERDLALRLADEISPLPVKEQQERIRENPRFHNPVLADLLLERSYVLGLEDPAQGAEIGQTTLEIVDRLAPHGCILANDLRARTWACIGNARRILSDFRTAEMAFAKAEAFITEGSGDLLESARILDFKASLLRAQCRFESALATIDKVISTYRRLHDGHRHGRALMSKAMIHGCAGEQENAISLFFQALDLIDVSQEPRLTPCAYNNLLLDLTELGRYQEARALLPEVHKYLATNGHRIDRIKACWVEAKLESEIGHPDAAEFKLRIVCDGFIALGMSYDAALALLDLAKVYVRQGRAAECRQFVMEIYKVFISGDIPREALDVLVFFEEAIDKDRATVTLAEEVTRHFKRAYGNPGLHSAKPS